MSYYNPWTGESKSAAQQFPENAARYAADNAASSQRYAALIGGQLKRDQYGNPLPGESDRMSGLASSAPKPASASASPGPSSPQSQPYQPPAAGEGGTYQPPAQPNTALSSAVVAGPTSAGNALTPAQFANRNVGNTPIPGRAPYDPASVAGPQAPPQGPPPAPSSATPYTGDPAQQAAYEQARHSKALLDMMPKPNPYAPGSQASLWYDYTGGQGPATPVWPSDPRGLDIAQASWQNYRASRSDPNYATRQTTADSGRVQQAMQEQYRQAASQPGFSNKGLSMNNPASWSNLIPDAWKTGPDAQYVNQYLTSPFKLPDGYAPWGQ